MSTPPFPSLLPSPLLSTHTDFIQTTLQPVFLPTNGVPKTLRRLETVAIQSTTPYPTPPLSPQHPAHDGWIFFSSATIGVFLIFSSLSTCIEVELTSLSIAVLWVFLLASF
jgi:hypothetical protein